MRHADFPLSMRTCCQTKTKTSAFQYIRLFSPLTPSMRGAACCLLVFIVVLSSLRLMHWISHLRARSGWPFDFEQNWQKQLEKKCCPARCTKCGMCVRTARALKIGYFPLSLWPLCGRDFSGKRTRIPKTVSENVLPEDDFFSEDAWHPEDEFIRRIQRRWIAPRRQI